MIRNFLCDSEWRFGPEERVSITRSGQTLTMSPEGHICVPLIGLVSTGEKIPLWAEKPEELHCALFFTTNCFALVFNYVCSLRLNILRFDHTAAPLRKFCPFSQLSADYIEGLWQPCLKRECPTSPSNSHYLPK